MGAMLVIEKYRADRNNNSEKSKYESFYTKNVTKMSIDLAVKVRTNKLSHS